MKTLLCWVVVLVLPLSVFADDPKQDKKSKEGKAEVKIYDEKADAKALIETARSAAKRENRRVLVQWGGNWCH